MDSENGYIINGVARLVILAMFYSTVNGLSIDGDKQYTLELPELEIKYARTENDLIIFNISQPMTVMEDVRCFHESLNTTGRVRTDVKVMKNAEEFGAVTKGNGNYWCLCTNKNYSSKESEKVVFVTNKQINKNTSVLMLKKSKLLAYLLGLHPGKYEDLSKTLCPGGKCQSPSAFISLLNKRVLEKVKISEQMDVGANVLLHLTGGAQTLLNYFLNRTGDVVFTRKLMVCETSAFVPEAEVGHEVIRRDLCKEFRCEGDYIFGAVWRVFNVEGCEQNTEHLELMGGYLQNYTGGHLERVGPYLLMETSEEVQNGMSCTSRVLASHSVGQLRDVIEYIPNDVPPQFFKKLEEIDFAETLPRTDIQGLGARTTTVEELFKQYYYPEVLQTNCTKIRPELNNGAMSKIPEKQIQYVMRTIDTMLDHPVNTTSLSQAATLVNSLLKLEENVTIPSIIFQNFETLVSKVVLTNNESQITIKESDMAIIVADNSEEKPVVGIKISPSLDEASPFSTEMLTSGWPTKHSENSIILVNMSSVLSNHPSSRVSFVVYRNDRAFLNLNQSVGGAHQTKVNSKIISIQLGDITELSKDEYVDIHFKPYENNKRNEKKACVFWNFTLGSTGQWSTAGCEFLEEAGPEGLDTCRCYHLTHFAQLITSDGRNINEFHYKILTRISFYGSILSITGLVIIALTGAVFKAWRKVFVHKLWLNLAASVGIMIVGFLFASEYDFGNDQSQKALCEVSGMILHYSVLSTFSWMFVIALFYYQMTVHVFKSTTYTEKCTMISLGWLLPAAPITALLFSNSDSYSFNFLNNQYDFCYPSGLGFWLGVFLPILLIIICNTVILIRIMHSIHTTSRVNSNRRTERDLVPQIKRVSFLFYQFGLVWLFGLFSRYLVMVYLFCITASIQGLILSYIFVLGNRNTRKLLFSKLHIGLGEEASYVKPESFSPSNALIKKNNSEGKTNNRFEQVLSFEETSCDKSGVFSPTAAGDPVKENKWEEGRKMDRCRRWRQCKNSNKVGSNITTRIPVCSDNMCSCPECSEEAYLVLLRGDQQPRYSRGDFDYISGECG